MKVKWTIYIHWYIIGDVANSKCHRRLDKIFVFLPALHRGIRKVVFKKTQSCNMPTKLYAILLAQYTLAKIHAFHTAYACSQNVRVPDRAFLQTTLLISRVVQVKIKISSSRWWRLELATSAIGHIGIDNLTHIARIHMHWCGHLTYTLSRLCAFTCQVVKAILSLSLSLSLRDVNQ